MPHNALYLLWTFLAALAAAIFVAARACVRGAFTQAKPCAADSVIEPGMKARSGVARPRVRSNRAHRATRPAGSPSPAIAPHAAWTAARMLASRQRGARDLVTAVSASN